MTPEERARQIIDAGGQILLPYEAGDAEIRYSSRRELAAMISTAIREAVEAERKACLDAIHAIEVEDEGDSAWEAGTDNGLGLAAGAIGARSNAAS